MLDVDLLTRSLASRGYRRVETLRTGIVYDHPSCSTCLIVDLPPILTLQDFHYVDYTAHQNALAAKYDRLFRFLCLEGGDLETLLQELQMFCEGEQDREKVLSFGPNRTEQDIDPTPPEGLFEDGFLEAFGAVHRDALHFQFGYVDYEWKRRYLDFALVTRNGNFAIELNGETYHHPRAIGAARYRSQLFKQNSLFADGFKVFRWSLAGMADRTRFLDELRRFLGPSEAFLHKSLVKLGRAVETFSLLEHQEDALEYISELRREGRNAVLVVQPTGTGKTEIFLEDFRRLKELTPALRALVIVPSRALREQTLERFRERLPGIRCSDDFGHRTDYDVCVQTSAFMLRHYHECDREEFGYIVVDEAQHAPAAGLRAVLEYFNPANLLGVTATPDRLDQKKLEDLFGEYESVLSLKDAILRGLVAPIRCFRVKSNIDLSEVRFNGRDYVKSDLQRTLVVPSRDQLIVNVLVKYFGGAFAAKQGVVFCVSLQHAERVAKALNRHGIPAQAVSGADPSRAQQALEAYRKGKLRFLCACDLLTEGWDSPQTSIVVMARPTFSQVLYTQQLGRGTRLCEGKEALYVVDVVDNYATRLQPLSLHAVLGVGWYQPFANVLMSEVVSERLPLGELEILDGLYEGVRAIEEINVFNYENAYGHLLNEEQLARELFVSTGTVTRWVKQGKIPPDQVFSFGRREIRLFEPARLPSIRQDLGLKEHDEETRREDFFELLEQRDYTFSYKIVFLLSFLKHANDRGEAALPDLVGTYAGFYRTLLDQHGRCEAGANPYNRPEFLADPAAVQRSLLQNPFEKFERKRFMYHCKDLNYLAFDPFLWSRLEAPDKQKVRAQMVEDLKDYFRERSVAVEITEQDFASLLAPGA